MEPDEDEVVDDGPELMDKEAATKYIQDVLKVAAAYRQGGMPALDCVDKAEALGRSINKCNPLSTKVKGAMARHIMIHVRRGT